MARVVYYTAIFGDYDVLYEPYFGLYNAEMVCFTDQEGLSSRNWKMRLMERTKDDPTRDARRMKALAHRWFPEADVTVWVDANLELIRVFDDKELGVVLGEADMSLYRHDSRKCAYDEAAECQRLRRDDRRVVSHQMARYRREGFPKDFGLVSSGFLIRRRCPGTAMFNEAWWAEIEGGSRRDQLSFDYCRWKLRPKTRWIDGNMWDGKIFMHRAHKKEGT